MYFVDFYFQIKHNISDVVMTYTLNKTFSALDYYILSSGKLKVRCQCDVFDVIRSETEVVLDEDKPRLASILQPHEYSIGKIFNKMLHKLVYIACI